MNVYEEILVPVGSDPSRKKTVEHAIELAETYGARVHALHVSDLLDRGHAFDEDDEDEGEDDPVEQAVDGLLQAADAAGLETRSATRSGTPYEEILDYVETEGIDLVVMGTHGKSGLTRMLLGSTAEEVLRRSPVPVLTVKG